MLLYSKLPLKIVQNSTRILFRIAAIVVLLISTSQVRAQIGSFSPMVSDPTNPPGAPGRVSGPASVMQGSTSTYTVTAASGATSYTWAVTSGSGTITGSGTSATVNWNASYAGVAYVSCSAVNLKGSTAGQAESVQVTQPATQLISGTISPTIQNINSNSTPTTLTSTAATGGNGIYSYQWQSSLNNSTWAPASNGLSSTYTPQYQTSSTYYRLLTTSNGVTVTSNTAFVNNMVSSSYSPSNNIVSVNELTGTANVTIPLYTIKAAHIDFPINLVYSATGVKGNDMEGNAGMGWNVSLGGAVTRQLRGLPDDVTKDNTGVAAAGWLYANNGSAINSLSFVNDNNTSTCIDEGTDISTITSGFAGNTDTEPDIFQVNAPGLSCQLVFDKNNVLQVIPYQDLKISYATSAQGNSDQGQIISFKITNDQGITYVFSATLTTTQKAAASGSVNYFKSNYNYYKNGITYYNSWGLTSITDIHGNGINVNYSAGPTNTFSNPIQLSLGGSGGALTTIYTMGGNTSSHNVVAVNCSTSILGQGQDFQIAYKTNPQSNKSVITAVAGMGHNFVLNYNNVTSDGYTGIDIARFFLSSITDQPCAAQTINGQTVLVNSYAPLNLTFNYIGTGPTASSLATPGDSNIDYWGYTNSQQGNGGYYHLPAIDINPSTLGYEIYRNKQLSPSPSSIYTYGIAGTANLEADQDCTIATLSQINYPTGGYTALSYEPNDYYDNTAQSTVKGGGIRITQILDHDAISTDNDFIKSYTYRDASGNSTGKPISLPVYAFTVPYSGTQTGASEWTSSTMVSPVDLSTADHSILYTAVTETVNNIGYTVYKYLVPATNWDSNVEGDITWSPTIVYTGRAPGTGGSCQNIGVLKNDVNIYPFPPNPNYDFERGLLYSVSNYNNAGTEVSEIDYTYKTPETPVDIAALKYDENNYATNYAKYTIHTSAAPLLMVIVNKIFDLTNVVPGAQPTNITETVTDNYYNTTQHKLSQQLVFNSEGSITTTNIKYLKDYNLTVAGDSYTSALFALQNDNMNMPVETYTQFTPVNSTQAYTTHADLVLYGTFPNQGIPQIYHTQIGVGIATGITMEPGPAALTHLTFNSAGNVTDFAPSSIANASSSPSFQHDGRYIVAENYLGYDYAGALLSSNDGFSHVKTNLYDNLNAFRLRATITNASYDQIGMDFPESAKVSLIGGFATLPNLYNFSNASNPYLDNDGPSRKGEPSLTLPATQPLTKVLNKNPQAQNYIFSIWINSSGKGSFTVSLTDGTNNSSKSFNYDATAGNPIYPTGFEYCQVSLPVGSLSASSPLTLNFSGNTDINFTDVMTYPDIADVVYYSYDSNQNQISSTNGNGVSTYYSHDALGRITYAYDQDNNIIERKTYVNSNPAINSISNLTLSWKSPNGWAANAELIQFATATTGNTNCTFNGNSTYNWNFGDGITETDSSLVNASHTYSGAKGQQYTCTLTITSPYAAPYSVSSVITL